MKRKTMDHLELDAQQAQKLLAERERKFIETRLLIQQWCSTLIRHYNSTTEDIQAKLPPLPGTTPETLLPSLFVENPQDFNPVQYAEEAAVVTNIQAKMNQLFLELNKEAIRCLSASTQQS